MDVWCYGRLLGYVISKKGISSDPDRIEAISKISMPASKKKLKLFFGKINFVKKFITRFAEIIRPLNEMLKKDAKMEWTPPTKKAFEEIKQAIAILLILLCIRTNLRCHSHTED